MMSAALSFSASVSGARVAVKVGSRRRRARARASVHDDGRDLNARETGDARRPRTSRGREIRPGMVRVDNAKHGACPRARRRRRVRFFGEFRDDATDETRLFRREMYRKKRE